MTPTENHLNDFATWLQQTGYGSDTCKTLTTCTMQFCKWSNLSLWEIEQHHIEAYYEWLQVRPHSYRSGSLSTSYITHHVYALRTWFGYLEQTGEITSNPISGLKTVSTPCVMRSPLSTAAIQQLFETASTLQERALLHLFYSCGLRKSEAIALNVRDFHWREQMLYVRHGKGAKRRAIPLPEKVTGELKIYMEQERAAIQGADVQEAFILTEAGKRMGQGACYKSMKKILKKAGLGAEITPHQLRHSIATHLLENGISLEQVRDFLGHRYLETTRIYAKVNYSQLITLVQKTQLPIPLP